MNSSLLRRAALYFIVALAGSSPGWSQTPQTGPADATILLIRHAEKPESGVGLSEAGEKRANAYPGFFEKFQIDSKAVRLDFLIATRDSDNSQRPKLTLQPVASALQLPLETPFKNKDSGLLAEQLKAPKYRGKTILICWHHGHLPDLLLALGADPARLFPSGKWPEGVFNWLVQLRYNNEGRLKDSAVINEKLLPFDS